LTGQRQHATARAQSPTLVLMVSEQVMHRLMEIQPAVQHYFEQSSNIRSLETIMKRIALFQGMADADIRWIVQQTQIQRYERGERLFSEEGDGQPVRETLHILLEGFVKVARRTVAGTGRDKTDERIIAYRQHGDYFAGGLDMLGDCRSVTVTAITHTRVAKIPRQAMIAIFNRYPEVARRFNERLRQYREDVSAAHTGVFEAVSLPGMIRGNRYNPLSDAEARIGLHSLVDEGVIEGTDVLVIDLDRCVHCGECEEACARRHGYSRMNRKGMVVGNLTIATACRQCQDPVCMLCSRAGIARMPSGEVYITENCIGCGICAERCPYDNISIVTLSDKKSGPARSEGEGNLTWQKFSAFFKNGMGKEFGSYSPDKWLPIAQKSSLARPLDMQQPLDAYGGMLKKLAIKCDLCAGYDNQACVQACPTGAAFRTQPVRFFGSTEEILRRRAR
jgi:Fe-S-cluster-containing hydrogenase component 2